jgi:hypothetical protein
LSFQRYRGAGDRLERQHFSHASINLIEYLRYNLSFVVARQDLLRKVTSAIANML